MCLFFKCPVLRCLLYAYSGLCINQQQHIFGLQVQTLVKVMGMEHQQHKSIDICGTNLSKGDGNGSIRKEMIVSDS